MVRFDNLSPMAAPPTTISRYEIKSRIGRGGMGDLYLAFDPNTNRLVALKLLNATLDSTELRERFAREARALAALNHPNIVNIYDTGEFEDSPFIVMEYVRGETLAELTKRRAAIPVSGKIKLMEELCAGLSQAHEAGIIHRDIKPANLMVDQQNHLKILDFGIARVAETNRTRISMPLTMVNMQIGTPGYMAPEQIEGGEIDHRADIFAVGAVCYELLAYDEAFSGANTNQIESRVMRGTPRPLASVVPGLDPEIDEIILRALKTDPNKRYQDASTFQRALEKYRLRLEPDGPDPSPRPTPPPPASSRGKSREARAEAAYQRALASYQAGSRDAARRFAVEAIAEDSAHPGARALLSRLEKRTPHAPAAPPRSEPPPRTPLAQSAPTIISNAASPPGATLTSGSTVVSGTPLASGSTSVSGSTMVAGSTVVSDSKTAADSTFVSGQSAADRTRTAAMPAASGSRTPSASAPTIVMTPPKPRGVSLWARTNTWFSGLAAGRRSGARGRSQPDPAHGARSAQQPIWIRYRSAMPIVALVLLIVLIGGGALLLMSWLRPSGQVLTVTKPSGGTLTGPGVRCGSLGSDCSVRRPNRETVELTPQADRGFVFRGYRGDCARGGLWVMTAAKTCGAAFEPLPAGAAAGGGVATQTLTISPVPSGGTLEGIDILCGTKGSVCTAQHPDGVPVELHPTADPGFTFMGFVGDCAPLGHTQMSAPRTCGATFSPTDSLKPEKAAVGQPSVRSGSKPSAPAGGSASGSAVPVPRGGAGRGTTDPVPTPRVAPPPGAVVVPRQGDKPAPPAAPPISDEDYAKNAVKDALKQYCAAYEALDPDAVQKVYPKAQMASLKLQLNTSKYKSMQCTMAEPKYDALDTAAGTAKLHVDAKHVYERTALGDAPETREYIVAISFSRANQRGKWFIESAEYRPKPKEK